MATYLVSYDLDKPGAEYDKLEEWLRNSGAQQILKSQWVLKSSEIEKNLERIVMGLIVESTDSILVIPIASGGFAFWNRLNISDTDFKYFIND